MRWWVKTAAVFVFMITGSCIGKFQQNDSNGNLENGKLTTEAGVNNLLIGAYSMLDGVSNQFIYAEWDGASTNWLWGSIRGLEANKGSDDGNQAEMNQIQTFSEDAGNSKINNKWRMIYEGVSRCNHTINVCNEAIKSGTITEEAGNLIIRQAKALRGHYHFEAWLMWHNIPYIDENTDPQIVTNKEDVTGKILSDLTAGTELPENMGQVGRFNATVCKILLAKALMQMKHDYDSALTLLKVAEFGKKPNGDTIGLDPNYGEIFDISNRKCIESVYTVQYSVNDGSGGASISNTDGSNKNEDFSSPLSCCSFYIPNQEFVNTFRTSGGLPLPKFEFDLPQNAVKNDQGLSPKDPFRPDSGPLDPRLDWSVGRRGIPYLDWGVHTGADWIRDQSYSGPYSPKKQVTKKSQTTSNNEVGGWTSGWTANGYRMIRYADILLMIAECEIEKSAPDLEAARAYINKVRARAMNPQGFVKNANNSGPAANYQISIYKTPFSDIEAARYALRIERKLELGLEGHRYFDLNRWGITVTELNRVLDYQKTLPWGSKLYGHAVVGPEDVTYPIPQRQIDLSVGALVQNR